ncbi:phospho-2-dehydro-3-deoxyheptonate aldolase [Grosmannia clavigera kw1407]|uniref:Phospho-2-dehydro-3-deoxyheptonate aldolase n=1 Tax=Grosmannia clavigera (strain kw1407 / UAMH 11150) TaxID=655863 RepID=F0XDI8_GROCL|nr:phospho-2-dehydro-3-deoxyheptonate aldolase [Grosmannia clavigera kw1407]EFX03799.1 phospho-2-dehydro-3-deoxyheptonate aldolase [Grosmannia clavigera kw1407]
MSGEKKAQEGDAAWTPSSWRTKPIRQSAEYEDAEAVARATAELRRLPPLVHAREIARLKQHLAAVARGEAFLLQGGDCAELFDYCEAGAIESKIKLLLQMSLVLIWGADKPVVRIGRMAGQYAKPRSSAHETLADGRVVPSFRGDILNGHELDERTLDPGRLVQAYHHSAATLNYVRSAIGSGIADLHRPLDWDLGHVRDPVLKAKYSEAVAFLTDMLRFMHTIGADRNDKLDTVDLYTSHESLVLEYEEPLTRTDGSTYYDTSAHFLWIGDRTRQVDGAHVEFLRGVANPVGVKVGPTTPPADLLTLLRRLNPDGEPGKVTLITRYGAGRVRELLPGHIRAVEGSEFRGRVVWQCDPMHGNTQTTATNVKTRHFADIVAELRATLQVHTDEGSYLGGVHLELTGDAVTECLGGSEGLDEDDLSTNYTTFCDPRLNQKQALEMAFLIADHHRQVRQGGEEEGGMQS